MRRSTFIARQEQFRQESFARHAGVRKKLSRRSAQPAGLEHPTFVEKNERLIKTDERRPDVVIVPREHLLGSAKQLEAFERLALTANANRGEGEGLGSFVSESQPLETVIRGMRQLHRLVATP